MKQKRTNYLEQSFIRDAIHSSKKTFCWYADERYSDFDVIVHNANDITPDAARAAMPRKAELATRRARAAAKLAKGKNLTPKESDSHVVNPLSYSVSDVVFRVMTDEHVPADPEATGTRRRTGKAATNFPPFKHYICNDAGELTEVGRSHWEGSLGNGSFSTTHGKLTNALGKVYMLLTERLGTKGNYRGYTYLDEMRGQALETLVKNGLKFDESKSDNAFAYLTVCCTNAFNRVLNEEKAHREMRDDMLQDAGMTPSLTRQLENENNKHLPYKPRKVVKAVRAKPIKPDGRKRERGATLTAHGRTQTVTQWAKEIGVSNHTIYLRIKKGWSEERCVAPPHSKTPEA